MIWKIGTYEDYVFSHELWRAHVTVRGDAVVNTWNLFGDKSIDTADIVSLRYIGHDTSRVRSRSGRVRQTVQGDIWRILV